MQNVIWGVIELWLHGANRAPRHHHSEVWHRGVPRFGRLHAATSILNCVRGLLCTSPAPGTRFGFSFRYDYRFSEQLQFVARDCA